MKLEHDNQIPQIVNYQQPVTTYQVAVGGGASANQAQYSIPQATAQTNPPALPPGMVYAAQHGNQIVVDQNNISVPHAVSSQIKSQPTYVNAKQYHRILKRREARRKLDEYYVRRRKQCREEGAKCGDKRSNVAMGGAGDQSQDADGKENGAANGRRPYIHESRHKHAMKRPRGPGGRFLTKDELVGYYQIHPEDDPSNPNNYK